MMARFFRLPTLVLMLLLCATATVAKVQQGTVYMFGLSASFTDSVVYITPIYEVDSAYVESKHHFLMDRSVYSDQLQTYIEAAKGGTDCVCVVFFNEKKKKIQQEYSKLLKRYTQDRKLVLRHLSAEEFVFDVPAYDPTTAVVSVPSDTDTAAQGADKKKGKKRKGKGGRGASRPDMQ